MFSFYHFNSEIKPLVYIWEVPNLILGWELASLIILHIFLWLLQVMVRVVP
jgi:hypothetical protein